VAAGRAAQTAGARIAASGARGYSALDVPLASDSDAQLVAPAIVDKFSNPSTASRRSSLNGAARNRRTQILQGRLAGLGLGVSRQRGRLGRG
jgi:D-alanyl-D-alanine dipeptidase